MFDLSLMQENSVPRQRLLKGAVRHQALTFGIRFIVTKTSVNVAPLIDQSISDVRILIGHERRRCLLHG